jgi:tetratricopeptide (TPR) repeat protein
MRATVPAALAAFLGIGAFSVWLLLHFRYAPLLEVSRLIATGRAGEASFAVVMQYLVSALALLRYPTIDPDVLPAALPLVERLLVIGGLLAATITAWSVRRTRPHLMFCLLWTGLWLAPLYAVPVRYDAVAERHFYPAIWGVAFGLCLEAFRGWSARSGLRRLAHTAGAIAAGIALSIVTLTRNADYRSEIALWEAARRSAPTKIRVLNNLGVAYMEAGRWDEAEAVLRQAVAIAPSDELVNDNLLIAKQREFGPVRWPQRGR